MKKETEEERRKVWKQIFASEMIVKKYNGNTYIGYLGMYIKLSEGRSFVMDRKKEKWFEVDALTLQPLKPKCEKKFIDRSDGYERYGT